MHKDGSKIQRSVFQNVQFDPIEENKITEVETQLQSEGIELPKGWNRGMTLKFCFTGDFKTEQITQNIKRHLEWKNDTKMHILTPEAQHFLTIGACYQFGRDHMHRPLVYIKISLVPTDINRLQPFLTALCYLLTIVQTQMCEPYYVERMRIIIDTKGISLLRLPCQVIKRIIEVTQHNYCGCLESMFLLDPPFIFRAASKIIQSFIHPDTQARIRILGQDEYSIMHRYIPENHLQKIHGGSHENLKVYWPIQIVELQEESIYFSMHDHIEYGDVTQSEDSQCQCTIF
ncbi:hypothetical protein pb186bvf_000138 [Paramecium bursaria]